MWHLGYADFLDPEYIGPTLPNNIFERIGECMLLDLDNTSIAMNEHAQFECQVNIY